MTTEATEEFTSEELTPTQHAINSLLSDAEELSSQRKATLAAQAENRQVLRGLLKHATDEQIAAIEAWYPFRERGKDADESENGTEPVSEGAPA